MAYHPSQASYPRSHLEFTTHPSLRMLVYYASESFLFLPSYLPSADIRDARDAHIILEAVRLNVIPLITRRLSSTEREQLSSGNVFVWEEAEFKGGLERWTDGRRWKVTTSFVKCSEAELFIQILGLKAGCVEIIYFTRRNSRRLKKNATLRLRGGAWHFFLVCPVSLRLCSDDASI
jgi:hypothetical protein